MPFHAKTIADWFIAHAASCGQFITQMKLQKLVYISHGWYLGLTGQPLIFEEVEAWQWGPVIRGLYSEFVEFGSKPINRIDSSNLDQIDAATRQFLERIWDVYGSKTAAELSALTHLDNTPWEQTYSPHTKKVIHNDLIKKHYDELLKR
jgi:uncharacterized phage-associated protein